MAMLDDVRACIRHREGDVDDERHRTKKGKTLHAFCNNMLVRVFQQTTQITTFRVNFLVFCTSFMCCCSLLLRTHKIMWFPNIFAFIRVNFHFKYYWVGINIKTFLLCMCVCQRCVRVYER